MLTALAAQIAVLTTPTVGDQLSVRWTAPSQCPQEARVRDAIDANLGREAFGSGLEAVRVSGEMVEDPKGWKLSVTVALPETTITRDVVAADCTELAEAGGLIIAVALDPLRVAQTVEPPPPGYDEEEAPVAEPQPVPIAEPQPRRLNVDLRVAGVGEFGSFRVLRGGVGLGAGLVGRTFRLDLSAQYWAPRRLSPFATMPGAGVAVQQAGLGVRGCLRPRLRAVEVSSCLGFEVGASWARGFGLGQPRTSALPWAALVFGQEIAWTSRRRVGVWFGIDGMLHVVRPRFTVADLGVAAQSQWVGLRVAAGPSVRL